MTFKIAKLSSGQTVQIDVETMRRDIKTRRDVKEVVNMPSGGDSYDCFLAKYSGMTMDEIVDLSIADWKEVDQAVAAALKDLSSPN